MATFRYPAFATAVLLAALTVLPVRADDPLPVSEIVADPDAFHLKRVTVAGIVGGVRVLDPYFLPSGTACYGAYTFVLEDEGANGAFLDVAVLGICGPPMIRYPDVSDGEQVLVEADIQIPGRFGTFLDLQGSPLSRGDPPAVQALARTITRLGH